MDLLPLITWFKENKRSFPWRVNPSPYAVWVSEMMLQQTQAAVVVPYFQRWMQRFPTMQALSNASSSDVIKMWEGLGYYARARALHEGAKKYSCLPTTQEELLQIKGIGPYTAGAILSFAYQKRAAAVDANVLRVMSRLFALGGNAKSQGFRKEVEAIVGAILPEKEPYVAMEALIELGALVCSKRPKCHLCPLQKSCKAHLLEQEELFPSLPPREKTRLLSRFVPLIECDGFYLIQKKNQEGLMAGLHQFPYFEMDEVEDKALFILKKLKIKADYLFEIPSVCHSFTVHKATLYPSCWQTSKKIEIEGHEWISLEELEKCALSSGHKKILQLLFSLKR